MATTPLALGATYTKLVDTAVAAFTLQVKSDQGAEIIFAAAAPAEADEGLMRAQYETVTRAFGTGHVYGRVPARPGSPIRVGRAVLLT